jgi:hypothetical protein
MPDNSHLRASDADRERVVNLLREHHAEGRLDMDEFHDRLNAAYEAKTIGDLDALTADLPAIDLYRLPSAGLRPAPAGTGSWAPARRPGTAVVGPGAHWAIWSVASSILAVAWLLTGAFSGGLAWLPWFLLIVIPWAVAIRRRS